MTPDNSWHYLESGSGPPLLLLHGLGASGFSWRNNIGVLSRYFRVVAPDLPPHGRSPAPPDGDYSLEGQVQGLVGFLDHLGIPRAAVAGNSLGGGLALLLARDYPDRVNALILLAPAAALTRLPFIFYPLRLPGLGKMLAPFILGPWIIPFALRLIYHRRELITPQVVAGYAAPFREMQRRLALASLCRQVQLPPLTAVEAMLAHLRPPIAILWGEQDRILPVSQAQWLRERLPQATIHLLPAVGHAPQEEAPAVVNEIIIDFLTHSINN
ncbi:MAG: alpha/beta fold hydrolase [Syntrophales bacterium]|nr:alpha/beta fold hydrolase [Syntrophales bacterium]MDD5642877.1 alpha/beta fold hydrolase [Syntrophales bacterium]